ncbi:MAG TPA: nuclear transport factor 2 family protein [Sediminibacterium sp.]|nr:nuclear transport factor 2 family protein [Sediminibacterium sp.]
MKYLFFCLLSLFSCFVVNAQSKEEIAVTDRVEQMRKAMIDADSAKLAELVSDKLSYGHSTGRLEDKATFIGNIISGKSDFVTISLTEQTVTVEHDVAIVRHILSATTNDSGKPGSIVLKILLVWVKQHGKWILLARQAVRPA